MKKGLIGIVVLAFVALICGTALAATFDSFDVTGDVVWTIFDETGLMPAATSAGPTITVPQLTLTAGPWTASTDGDYITYTAEMATVGLYVSRSYAIYDLAHDITAAQGFTLVADIAPLSVDLLYTTGAEYGFGLGYAVKKGIVATETTTVEVEVVDEETWAWVDDDENAETPPVWGHPMKTVEEEVEEEVAKEETVVDIGVKYNSTGAYGVKLVYPMAPITLTGQYAAGTLLGASSAYIVKGEYALTAGKITLQYKSTTAPLLVPTTIEISAGLADFPITGTTLLGATVTSTDGSTAITGTTVTTLVEGVKLTLAVGSDAGVLTYSGKIGVAL